MKNQKKITFVKTERPASLKDLTGKRFGKWLVLGYAGKNEYESSGIRLFMHMWLCRCKCGVEKFVHHRNLIAKRSSQCQRCAIMSLSGPPKDLKGKRFGKWLVLKYAGKKLAHLWLCRCECGTEKKIPCNNLLRKLSTQCQRCAWNGNIKPKTKHCLAWRSMKYRESLPKVWRDYEAFCKAVGEPPDDAARLLRYDNAKPHGSGNTYWAMPKKNNLPLQIPEDIKEKIISQSKVLTKVRNAKTKEEKLRSMLAARKANQTYRWIAYAAKLTHQRVHQIITKCGCDE